MAVLVALDKGNLLVEARQKLRMGALDQTEKHCALFAFKGWVRSFERLVRLAIEGDRGDVHTLRRSKHWIALWSESE